MRIRTGFTLVEVLAALVVLGVGLIPVFQMAAVATRLTGPIQNGLIAANLGQEGVEVIRAMRDDLWFSSGTFGAWAEGPAVAEIDGAHDQSQASFLHRVSETIGRLFVAHTEQAFAALPDFFVNATFMVCDNESDLPNWGLGGPNITFATAQNFLSTHPNCRVQSGASFQYADQTANNPGDNTGPAGAGWTTFGPTGVNGQITATVQNFNGTQLRVREAWSSAYMPFTYGGLGGNNNNPVSSEFYCADDVGNYDNFDFIGNLQGGQTYYCVAWNAVASPTPTPSSSPTPPPSGPTGPTAFSLWADELVVQCSSGCAVQSDSTEPIVIAGDQRLHRDPLSGLFQYTTGPATIFTRMVTITKVSDSEIKVLVRVTWTEHQQAKEFVVESYLFNWLP